MGDAHKKSGDPQQQQLPSPLSPPPSFWSPRSQKLKETVQKASEDTAGETVLDVALDITGNADSYKSLITLGGTLLPVLTDSLGVDDETLLADLGLAGLTALVDAGQAIPLVGDFVTLLGALLQVLQDFKCNKDAAKAFGGRLKSLAKLLEELVVVAQQSSAAAKTTTTATTKGDLLDHYVGLLNDSLVEAKTYFDQFTKAGFLRNLIKGTEPKRKFDDFDAQMTRIINELNTVLGLKTLQLQAKTCKLYMYK